MSIFKGAAVAIITPMTETQEVNYEKLGELIDRRRNRRHRYLRNHR